MTHTRKFGVKKLDDHHVFSHFRMDEQLVQLDAIYDLPWNRMGPYLVGVITGYILVVKLQKKLELKKVNLFNF